MREVEKERQAVPTPEEIYAYLDRHVIGQEKAKRTIAVAAYNHRKRVHLNQLRGDGKKPIRKSNILLIGPTGCGKTHIARNLAACLDLPFTIVDATEYTEAGYYGKDVEVMVGELLFKTGGDVEKAQQGIVFVDEVDKIARRTHGARTGAGSRDIGGEGVQQGMLKLLEGTEVFVPLNITQHWSKHDFVLVDTAQILFLCAGTFTDLRRCGVAGEMGFARGAASGGRRDLARKIGSKELEEYGMIAEFLGRLPVIVEMDELTEEQLYQILTVPPDSIVREYKDLVATDGIDLAFTKHALQAIASFAIRRRYGARGLRSIMEEVIQDLMFHAPRFAGKKVTIDKEYVEERLKGLL